MAELTTEKFEEGMESFAKIVKGGFDAVDKQFGEVKTELGSVKTELGSVKTELGSVKTELNIVKFDIAYVKRDMAVQFAATNKRIDDLAKSVDGFVGLHRTLEVEMVAMRDKYNRVARAHNALAVIVAPTSDVRI